MRKYIMYKSVLHVLFFVLVLILCMVIYCLCISDIVLIGLVTLCVWRDQILQT